jgi:hypothetical protein
MVKRRWTSAASSVPDLLQDNWAQAWWDAMIKYLASGADDPSVEGD